MSDAYTFRNLILWQKAQALTVQVIEITSSMPRTPAADVIARQIIRSSSSIAANIAEGHGRYSPRAHANYLLIARGSACETDSWLDLLRRQSFIDAGLEGRLIAAQATPGRRRGGMERLIVSVVLCSLFFVQGRTRPMCSGTRQ
ncbi:MAG: four helix bundle protein [Dehalococcoidia bacterium]